MSASFSQRGRSSRTKDDGSHRLGNLTGSRERVGAVFQSELGGMEVTAGTWPDEQSSLEGEVLVTLYSIDPRTMLPMLVSRTGAVGSDRCSPHTRFSERTILDWNLL
jgi:hypothetical protein